MSLPVLFADMRRAEFRLDPNLYPVLTILSKLSAGVETPQTKKETNSNEESSGDVISSFTTSVDHKREKRTAEDSRTQAKHDSNHVISDHAQTCAETSELESAQLLPLVLELGGSCILAVRELSAAALPAVVTKQRVVTCALKLASRLPPSSSTKSSGFNKLHGTLLQIQVLLKEMSPLGNAVCEAETEERLALADAVYSRLWLAGSSHQCFIVKAAFIRLVQSLREKTGVPPTEGVAAELNQQTEMLLLNTISQSGIKAEVGVGYDQYLRELVKWRLSMEMGTLGLVAKVIRSRNWDLVVPCLRHLNAEVRKREERARYPTEKLLQTDLQMALYDLVQDDSTPFEPRCEAFECVVAIYDVTRTRSNRACPDWSKNEWNTLWERMNSLLDSERNSRLAGYAVAVMATLVSGHLASHVTDPMEPQVLRFCDVLRSCSDPGCAEQLRVGCAHALRFSGSRVLHFLQRTQRTLDLRPERDAAVLNLVEASESLLTDENAAIRKDAARFVSTVMRPEQNSPKEDFGPKHMEVELATSSESEADSRLQFQNKAGSGIHPNVALEQITWWTRHCDGATLMRLVLQGMKSAESAAGVIARETKAVVDDLFAPEEVNPYRERSFLCSLRAQCEGLPRLRQNNPVIAAISEEGLADIAAELDEASASLNAQCVSGLNATCNKFVFDALWAIMQRTRVCLSVCPAEAMERNAVLSALRRLQEVPYLHPRLQAETRAVLHM